MFNGTPNDVRSFKNSTGATFPLLMNGASEIGGNLYTLYGDRDNWVVVNKQGICRLNMDENLDYPSRYQLDAIRGCVDSLVSSLSAAPDPAAHSYELETTPNPFDSRTTITFSNPSGSARPARVTIHDLAGRRVAMLWDGAAEPGLTRVDWDGRVSGGAPAAPGIYVVRSDVGGEALARRVVRMR